MGIPFAKNEPCKIDKFHNKHEKICVVSPGKDGIVVSLTYKDSNL